MQGRCARHPFEAVESLCRGCGQDFCGHCLVYAFGPEKPPYCIPCALAAGGVRSTTTTQARTRREIRREIRARKKALASGEGTGAPVRVGIEWFLSEEERMASAELDD